MKLFYFLKKRAIFFLILTGFIFLVFFGFEKINNEIKNKFMLDNKGMENDKKIVANNNDIKMEEEHESIKILFAGDLMLDRYNRVLAKNEGVDFFTHDIQGVLERSDLNVLNLEGPVTENSSISLDTEVENPAHFKFTFNKEITKNFLSYNKISLVNLGNNHILNFGEEGVLETVGFLRENKIDFFGSPLDEKNTYIEKDLKNLKIALLNYNRFSKMGSEATVSKIKDAKSKNDFVIVYAHWGSEYQINPSDTQKIIAHNFIDAGADLIIGSHPHVVQSIEVYKNKAIFYSLGNFVFDQFFSEEVKNELVVVASISDDKLEFELIPLYRKQDGSLSFDENGSKEKLLNRLSGDAIANKSIKEKISGGRFNLSN